MKIQREIDGILMETELTRRELYLAFCEYEHLMDCELCLDYVDKSEVEPDILAEFIDSMADSFRVYMDQGDWNVNDALDVAYTDTREEFGLDDEEEF